MASSVIEEARTRLTQEEDAAFHVRMHEAGVKPFWELNSDRKGSDEPESEKAFRWRWQTIEALMETAVRATTVEQADRRVLTLHNPNLAGTGRFGATTNLAGGIQVVDSGEFAPPHRHTMGAVRYAVRGDDISTIVEGKDCRMRPGDVIMTPKWTWHEHINRGADRALFIDVLDAPFHAQQRGIFFEGGPAHDVAGQTPDSAFVAPGMMPETPFDPKPASQIYRYPWTTAVAALEAVPPAKDGSRLVRYVNPTSGAPAMEYMGVALVGIGKTETRPSRTTSNALCIVADGTGTSHVGGESFDWQKNDLFTIPHWQWASHRATTPGAKLLVVSDRTLMERLDLLRDEMKG